LGGGSEVVISGKPDWIEWVVPRSAEAFRYSEVQLKFDTLITLDASGLPTICELAIANSRAVLLA
jgi:hypothetical protein